MLHDLKIWPQFFDAVCDGRKRAELRKNDRDFQVDDILNLREFDPVEDRYTGRGITVRVTDVQRIKELDARFKNVLGLNPCLAPVNNLALLSITLCAMNTTTEEP